MIRPPVVGVATPVAAGDAFEALVAPAVGPELASDFDPLQAAIAVSAKPMATMSGIRGRLVLRSYTRSPGLVIAEPMMALSPPRLLPPALTGEGTRPVRGA